MKKFILNIYLFSKIPFFFLSKLFFNKNFLNCKDSYKGTNNSVTFTSKKLEFTMKIDKIVRPKSNQHINYLY